MVSEARPPVITHPIGKHPEDATIYATIQVVHLCTSIRWWHCVYHTVTRITSFRCISHLLPLTEVQKNRFYVPYILVSFPVARLPGRWFLILGAGRVISPARPIF